MTRVAFLVEQCFAPVPGGTGRYTAELARALAAAAPPGAVVTGVSAWHRDVRAARIAGVAGPRRLPAPRRLLAEAWSCGFGPRVAGADLVHAPTPLAPPHRDVPLVVSVHDTVPWSHPEALTPRGVRWHRRAVGRAAAVADALVVPTEAVRRELAAVVPARRVEVVGEGADSLQLPPDEAARAARLELPTDYLVTLATFEPRKGLDIAVTALAHAGAPRLPLLVVGQPGWGGVDPTGLARRAGLPAGRLRVLGRLDDADLAVVLSRASAAVVPSRAEGFGLPALEAMALGTPVVVSDAPALVEVTGGAALVVPREDPAALAAALGQLADDPGLRQALADAGARRAAQYTWRAAAARMWRLYADLLAGSDARPGPAA